MRDVIRRKKQLFQPYIEAYFQYKHLPHVGLYSFNLPVLCINDPDLAKLILIKDFESFQSHGIFSDSFIGDPLGGHLFNIHGPKWKSLRVKLSPAFTPGKLKTFFPFVERIANDALEYSESKCKNKETLNFSNFYAKYAMELVGSVGFGIETNGFKNAETEFQKRGHQFFEYTSIYWTIVRAIAFFAPDFFKKFRMNRTDPNINKFFFNLVKDTVHYRERNNYHRSDFLQTLIDLKKNDNDVKSEKDRDTYSLTFTDVAANTMLYMLAGYETSATTGMYAAYELARNPDIQAKVRDEVNTVLAKHNGQWTYEAQNEMTYVNMVLDETMRKYPPMRALFRRCNRDYKVPNTDLVIEAGTLIFIPIHAIQMDPDIFEDPEKFDPERFTPEKKGKMHPCHWMPFGEGPRKCLGLRQGYIQSKMALVKLLSNYELLLDSKTQEPLRVKATSFPCAPEGGVWIKLRRL
ncbi:unnamed protein product [Leptosia nina]|uniref:unspecific monooxygenase n=1 Tax=Leptosia nina TaxID=320188 RepID=A0AAV1J189_9NEOP